MYPNDGETDVTCFCAQCFSNKELKHIVNSRGSGSEKCSICGANGVHTLSADDSTLRKTLRAMIRIYYSEYEYNSHLGGDNLSEILFGTNDIFALSQSANQEEFESAICSVEEEWYPRTGEDVSLGGGYWNGPILFSLFKYQHANVYRLAEAALRRNSYELLDEAKSLFDNVSDVVSDEIETNSTWFRARLGFNAKFRPSVRNYHDHYAYSPYSPKEVGAPPPHIAPEGRLNRHRTSVLYLASDELTAVSEIRPHPGHIISVGEFHPKKPIRVANLATPRVENYAKDCLIDKLHLAISLGVFANLPVTPETKHWYMATQLIGEAAREAGFDGMKFKSAVSSGTNLAVFDPRLFNEAHYVKPIEVKALTYETRPLLDASAVDLDDYERDNDTFRFNEMLNRINT